MDQLLCQKIAVYYVSDEALIHAKHGLTCMAKNKKLGASFCKENGANMIIMDDGLQTKI